MLLSTQNLTKRGQRGERGLSADAVHQQPKRRLPHGWYEAGWEGRQPRPGRARQGARRHAEERQHRGLRPWRRL